MLYIVSSCFPSNHFAIVSVLLKLNISGNGRGEEGAGGGGEGGEKTKFELYSSNLLPTHSHPDLFCFPLSELRF